MTDLSGAGVRVLLLGTATHPGPLLSPVPAAGRSATALADRLIRRCGVPPGQLRTIVDPPDAHSMAAAVSEEARRAESVLLIYYIGHGLPGPAGELYLAATGTDSLTPGLAAHQALPFSAIREAIGSCRADAVVVVLDCCFSARAGLDGRRPESAFTLPAAHGAYVLAAAQQLALAPEEEEYTTFSGELLRLLDEGDPLGPRRLTLDDVYEHLFRTLRAQGAPLPRRQVADRAGSLVVAANLAYRDVVDAPAEPEADLTDVRCPYLGLSSFGVDDAELFRGRGVLIAELFDAVARTLTGTLPLLVVGASGAGKSSLLSAGLLAGLANGVPGLPGTAGWPSIMLTPGERPVEVLATRLDPTGESAAQRLREDPTHAGRLAAALRERHGTERLVVVVDQLEQLFTPALDDLDRRVFLRALAAITGHALVVMALRADFFGHAMAHEELAAALRGNQLLVGPMGLDELQAAIEEPATTVGLRLDDGLADLMLLELGATRRSGADTGALPLLSHALWATWQRRTGARMTVAGYRASGGIAQAIATTADATYKALDPAGQEAVRRMLPRLVRVDDELNDTARTVDLADLQRGVPDPAAAERALHRLAAARLVTLDRATARISHEALLREWPLLRRWIDADRDWLRTHEQLRMDALAWRHAEQDQSLLYRGSRLATVRERAAGSSRLDELEPVTAEFLDRSSRQEGRTARLRTAVVAGLATLLVLALTATGAAVYQARAAATETRAAVVNSLVSRSGAVRDSQPATALRLGIAAATVDPSAETRAGLVRLLLGSRYAGEFHASDGPEVRGVVVSDDGRTAVVAAGELASTVWDVGDRAAPRQIGSLPHPKGKGWHTGATEAIGASADGRLVLDGNSVWDLHDPTRPVPVTWLPRRDDDNEGPTYAVAYNEARRLGIVGGGIQGQPRIHGIAALWDLHDPARPVRLGELAGHSGPVWTAAFSPDGDTVVTGSGSGTAVLWDVRSRRHPRRVAALTGHVGNVWTAAFGPDGRTVLTGAATDSNAVLWDVSTVALPHRIGVLAHGGPVSVVTFSADGQRLFTAGTDGNIRMWNAQDPAQAVPLSTAPARAVAFDGRGGLAITSGWGDASQEPPGVQLWEVSADGEPQFLSTLNDAFLVQQLVSNWYYMPTGLTADGRTVVTGGSDKVIIWDIADRIRPRRATTLHGSFAALSPDGTLVGITATSGDDHDTTLWDIADRDAPRRLGTIPVDPRGWASDMSISPDNHVLVDPGTYESQLWDIRDPRHPSRLGTVPGTEVAFSHDSRLLMASARQLGSPATVWDVHDPGNPVRLHQLDGHVGAFSPDGHMAVTAGARNSSVWDVTYPAQPQRLVTVDGYIGVAFSDDGQILQAQDNDGRLVQLQIGSLAAIAADPLATACAIVGRGMNADEWDQYAQGLEYRGTCPAG